MGKNVIKLCTKGSTGGKKKEVMARTLKFLFFCVV